MNFLLWILLGGIAGWIASIITKSNASMGLVANIVVGIIGAFIGGFLFQTFGGQDVTGFNLYSLLVATVGAVVLIWIIKMIRR
ncbi:MAG TPA: GlsB/YeaQ/YmgE family stress response membrane protein [Verrucomicrobiae bacterium]|nr:GlsB/YeaQ/YmgE family stress response membrane protein [Verrucomicrobiae bacterium]